MGFYFYINNIGGEEAKGGRGGSERPKRLSIVIGRVRVSVVMEMDQGGELGHHQRRHHHHHRGLIMLR